ncbi:MAG: hypothetical protein NTX50_17145 [Candidatus Sumerlaeota bacterium]|nr:hypothetical protein [Candidatus Sumerlaeota bacterium]
MNRYSLMITLLLAPGAALYAATPQYASRELEETVREAILPGGIQPEQGFCYIAPLQLGRAADNNARSFCALLENGKPLPLPRAVHADIRKSGAGRYSHWTTTSLYFSASDNSDPRANGRDYALVSRRKIVCHTATIRVTAAESVYRVDAGAQHPLQTRRLVMRNLDGRTAVAPKLAIKGWPDLSSAQGMLGSILTPGMTEEQKAIAIWRFLVDWRYHYYPADGGDEMHDPVKFINIYGYGFCDDSANNFAVLCGEAGIRARVWGLNGHVVGEAFYGGAWHMFDPDHQVYYRMPAGHVAGVEELAARPEVITRTPRDPIGSDSAGIARLYTTTQDNHPEERVYPGHHRLQPALLPGDEAVFDMTTAATALRIAFRDQPLPPVVGNGWLTRRIDLSGAGNASEIRIEWPYVILGGELRLELSTPDRAIEVALVDAKGLRAPIKTRRDGATLTAFFDEWFRSQNVAHYSYVIRLAADGGAPLRETVRNAVVATRFQFAPRALPQVQPGGTVFVLSAVAKDNSPLPQDWQGLEMVHEWDEVIAEAPFAD